MGPVYTHSWEVSREPGPETSFLVVQILSVVSYFSSRFILQILFLAAMGWMEPCPGEQRPRGLGVKQTRVDRDRASPLGHKWRPPFSLLTLFWFSSTHNVGVAGRE